MSPRAAAKAAGRSHYFTGKPCCRGHVAERYVSGGCVVCERDKNREYQKARRRSDPAYAEKQRQLDLKRRQLPSDKQRVRNYNYKRLYGIALADYEAMLREQKGACKVCRAPAGKRRLAVDHNHVTGKVRALLCDRCNPLIGYAHDDPTVLRRAAAYLERNQ